MSKQTILNRINRDLGKLENYHPEIPIDEIFNAIVRHGGMPIDEAGESWSGIFCGREGNATIEIKHESVKNFYLILNWYKMESGKFEVVVYVS